MIPIREKIRIQIEVTNACNNECTNCSRFVGHHKTPYFMDLELVEKAIDSVLDFPGTIGIIGGEPTLHPHFVDICNLMKKKVPPEKRYLFTAGLNWNKYERVIKKTFGENLTYNSHDDPTQKHHPMLLSISDVIDDAELVKRSVEQCWVDQRWSASINPKGCFFCEVAAAMDALFQGPGGLPIERGWWNKDPVEFAEQRERYCYQCGACVPFLPVTLEDKQDVISESNYQRLLNIGSPRLQRGRVKVIREKFPLPELAAMAKNWEPWNHFGALDREGAGKNEFERYGRVHGAMLRIRKEIRARFWTFRKMEILVSRLLWKLGMR